MNVRNICLQSDGIELAAELYVPPAPEPCPALCICHGVPANTYNPADRGYAGLAQTFCHAGFVTLIFNFRGAGKSQGNLDMLGWTRDLQVALNFLCDLDGIDRKRICLLGFSGGAAVSVYITAHDPRVSLLLACACPAHFRFVTNKSGSRASKKSQQSIGLTRFLPVPYSWSMVMPTK
jgi:alpha/beta superfamily hydrolase